MRLAIAALVALAVLAPAQARAQWEPVEVPGTGASPAVLFNPSGRALLVRNGSGPAAVLQSWKPGTAPGPARRIRGHLWEKPVRVGRDRVLLVLERRGRLYSMVVGISGRTLQGLKRIRPYGTGYRSAISSGPSGEVALAWAEPVPAKRFPYRLRLRLAIRPPGGTFRVVETHDLGHDDHPGPAAVAITHTSGGRLVLAFAAELVQRRRRVHALIGRPGRWRRQVLGRHNGISDMAAASNARGRAVVAWQTQDSGEEANELTEVHAAVLAPGARRFARTQSLDGGDGIDRWPGHIGAAVGPDGTAAVSWSQIAGRITYPYVVATASPGAAFSPPQILDPNGAAGDLAFAPDGRLLVSWSRITEGNYQNPDQAFAAQRAPGEAAFGAPEALSADVGATAPGLALDPLSGRFVAGWSFTPRYPDMSPAQPRLAIRAR